MNNKSKLSLFATVMLQMLVLIIPGTAFASAEADQEIGIPQPMEASVKGCFGAYLSPRGDRFYTVQNGMLTQYQINPIKKLGAVVKLGLPPLEPEAAKKGSCRVLVTDDEKKLIVVYPNWIYLLDLSSGQLLKKSESEYRPFPAIIINNDELLILGKFFEGNDTSGYYAADLAIWDINTLTLEKKIHQIGAQYGFIQDAGGFPTISKILDRIYMKSDGSLLVLNSKTYKPELNLLFGPATDSNYDVLYGAKPPPKLSRPRLSKDFRVLYAGFVTKVIDYLNGKETNFPAIKTADVLAFDQKTRKFNIKSVESLNLDALDPFIVNPLNLSRNRNYVMLADKSVPGTALLTNLNTNLKGRFYQYEAGEAIQQRCSIGTYRDCKEFQLTPGARKYLMMKNEAGKIVPINDATFNKFYRSDGLYQ